MKKVIVLLLCLFFLLPAKAAGDPKPYVAVFTLPDKRFLQCWEGMPVDFLMVGNTWDDFKIFCMEVQKRSKGAGVLVDIDCHGSDLLYMQYEGKDCIEKTYVASMGYILNQLREHLKGQVLELDVEACNAGRVYRQTIRNNKPKHEAGDIIENYDEIPPYPIYGVGEGSNWSNSIFQQRIHNAQIVIYDLRQFELDRPGETPNQDLLIRMFLRICELSDREKKVKAF